MAARIDAQSYVVEYGAGWSTRWFANRCGRLLSIETNRQWAETVRTDLDGAAAQWRVELAPRVDRVEIGTPDLVLVDCAEDQRIAAVQKAWGALAPDGWLIFDDAQRERHSLAVAWLSSRAEPFDLRWATGDIETAKERVAVAYQKSA